MLPSRYKVTVFYTAPTAIRALMRCGDEVRGIIQQLKLAALVVWFFIFVEVYAI
jgi:acyl-coenzyme A synthetase/AMP-(fatty) acid ligase